MNKKVVSLLVAALAMGCVGMVASADEAVSLEVESSLSGSAYTNGKSTLKNHLNTAVSYGEDSQAVFTLVSADGSEIDDSKIDASNAVVTLIDGEGYYADEYVFLATTLDGEWENGQYVYTLEEGDLEIDRSVYLQADADSGREWSCLGGDGHGNYHYTLCVSGIIYDGTEIDSQEFSVDVSIYGYDYTSDAISLYGEEGTAAAEAEFASLSEKTGETAEASDEPVWTWVGDGDYPILCDALADDFYITWPEGSDASAVTASDVTITLTSTGGQTLTLTADEDYFVSSSESETQIALTWQHWAFTPVYSTMVIEVTCDVTATGTFDVGSVYLYEAQQGGGGTTVDGTVTAYSFYGFENLESWEQIMSAPGYVLTVVQDDVTYYYAEGEDGNGILTENQDEAYVYDATEERDPQLVGNTVYITTRTVLQEIEKTVDGETIVFTQKFSSGGRLLAPTDCDTSLTAAAGYVIPWGTSNWITNEKWAWQTGIEEGWTTIEVNPYEGKFECSVAQGATQQFTCDVEIVSWVLVGDTDEGTSVTDDGLLTVAENESHASFAVTVTDAEGNLGTVTIKVTSAE
ncbi:MAG: hypothetical protein LUF30_10440 [Lachnospiraceae bacterium]|nr:hypothetical protein [Lachnospiraceae bacterium]